MAFDGEGNVVVTGYLSGSADFGGGSLVSAGENDILLVKLDPDGNHVWSKNFGDNNSFPHFQRGESLAIDAFGNIFLTGSLGGIVDFGGGPVSGNVYLAKFDSDGNHLWSRAFAGDLFYPKLAADAMGNVVLTAELQGAVDMGGGLRTSAGSFDVLLAKFDPNGDHLLSLLFGDSSWQQPFDLGTDPDGNIVLTGMFSGTMDFGGSSITSTSIDDIFLVKLDPNGSHLWSRSFPGSGTQYVVEQSMTLDLDREGRVVLAGAFDDTRDFGGGPLVAPSSTPNIFVAKFDREGLHLASAKYGNSNLSWNVGTALDPDGNVVITGNFNERLDFGGGALTASDFRAMYLAKLAVPPAVTLRLNGEDPPSGILFTTNPLAVTLDVEPGTENDVLDWYYAIHVGGRLYWVTSTGVTTTAAPLAHLRPLTLTGVPIFQSSLPPGSFAVFYFFLADGSELVSFDYVVTLVAASAPEATTDRLEPASSSPETVKRVSP